MVVMLMERFKSASGSAWSECIHQADRGEGKAPGHTPYGPYIWPTAGATMDIVARERHYFPKALVQERGKQVVMCCAIVGCLQSTLLRTLWVSPLPLTPAAQPCEPGLVVHPQMQISANRLPITGLRLP